MPGSCSSTSTEGPSRSRNPLRLPRLHGLADAEEQLADARLKSGLLDGRQRSRGLHQRFAGPAGLRDRDEARGRERQFREQSAVCRGIEIVHEMQARTLAERLDAAHADASQLRQRLPAQARSAGAQYDDVGRTRAQPRGGLFDFIEVGGLRRQPQKRQRRSFVRVAAPSRARPWRARARRRARICRRHARRSSRRAHFQYSAGTACRHFTALRVNSSCSALARGRPPR